MSSSQKTEGPRRPKCTRCRNHGVVVPQKGHGKACPFTLCTCWKCQLITERTRINSLQRKLRRGPECAGTGPSTAGQHIHPDTSPSTGAPQVYPRPIRVSEPRAPGPAGAEGKRFASSSPPGESSAQAAAENTLCGPAPCGPAPCGPAPCGPAPCGPAPCGPAPAPNPFYWRDYGPVPLPLLHSAVRMPSPFPHYSNFLVNMPWSPVPPGLYEGSLSPLMVPPYPPAPPYHPPPALRPPSSRPVFQPPAPPESHHQKALDKYPSTHPHKEEDKEEDSEHI